MIAYKVFTATTTGSALRRVTCEKCNRAYAYELARVGTGQGTALYFMFQRRAERTAASRAASDLIEKLENDHELVPCPQCGHVQLDAISQVRRRSYGGLKWGSIVATSVGAVGAGLLWWLGEQQSGNRSRADFFMFGWVFAALAFIGALGLLLRNWLVGRINPNRRSAKNNWSPPQGTPSALTSTVDAEGKEVLVSASAPAVVPPASQLTARARVPLPSRSTNALLSKAPAATDPLQRVDAPFPADGRCIVRALQFDWPKCCCVCMLQEGAEPLVLFSLPFSVRGDEPTAPLCRACRWRLRSRAWRLMMLGLMIGAVAGAVVYLIQGKLDPSKRLTLAIAAALIVGVALMAILPSLLVRVCRTKVIDAKRGLVEFIFDNPEYGRRLMTEFTARESERLSSLTAATAAVQNDVAQKY